MTRFVAVLDIGKTNVKLVLHDHATGADLFVRTTPNRVLAAPPYPHFDTEAIWNFALAALKDCARDHAVDAISVTTHGGSIVVLGKDGVALPVMDYEWGGVEAVGAEYDRIRPGYSETFSPRLPGGLNAGMQLLYLETRHAEAFANAAAIMPYPQYWAFRLTGVAACEATSLGSHTDLWAPREGGFSSLVTARGWDRLMPELRSAFDALGPVRPEIAAATGLDPATPVHCGIHDSNASLLPHLMRRDPPFAVISTGTWVIVFAPGGSLDGLNAERDGLANVDAFARPVPSARYMGGREFDLMTGGKPETPDPETVRRVIEHGPMVRPGWVPGCGPFPHAVAGWSAEPADAQERTAAAGLYAALMTAESLGVAGASGPIIVEGPFARNELYCEALEQITGRAVLRAAGATGTSAGAALLALGREATGSLGEEKGTVGVYDLTGVEGYAERWRAMVRGVM